MKRVAVIGAGISGLAAALALAEQSNDIEVTLFESSDRVGGVLETIRDGDYLVERSADNFATLIPNALELSRRCGLESELIPPERSNRQALVVHCGKLRPIPAGFSLMQPTRIGSILTTQTLSWRAKLRLLGEFWIPRRSSEGDESLESFSTRRLGRETFENLVEPIVSGIFTADPAKLSMRATMPQFVEMEQRSGGLIRGHLASRKQEGAIKARRASGARYDQFLAPRQGMSWWVNALAQRLPAQTVKLNTRVLSLRALQGSATGTGQNPSWQIETASEKRSFDGVICSAPAALTASLLGETLPAAAEIVAGIPYASSAVVAMVVDRDQLRGRTDAFGLIVPRKEGRKTLAISLSSNKYPGRVPDGQMLLRIFLGGALAPETVELPDSQLTDLAHTELRDLLGWTGATPKWQAVMRWREAMPQYVLGHVDRMLELKQALAAFPTLKLCGAAYSGVGLPQCVRGAELAATELIAALSTNEMK